MSWSLGETQALAVKAARGSRFSWGQAEDVGFSVVSLEASGLPGCAALARLLEATDSDIDYNSQNCPITQGAWASDSHDLKNISSDTLHTPILLLPFLLAFNESEPLSVRCGKTRFALQSEAICVLEGDPLIKVAKCSIEPLDANDVDLVSHTVSRVPDDRLAAITKLEAFAYRTYAPSTEATRRDAG